MNDGNRVLLIDLDNCPRQIDRIPQASGELSRVVAFHQGGVDPKVPLSLAGLLARAIRDGQLRIVAMPRVGKNTSGLGLAFWAGYLAAELAEDTTFVVLSQDGHLDHVVDMLRSIGRQTERVAGESPPRSGGGSCPPQPDHEAADEYLASLLRGSGARPLRRKTLLKSIKAFFRSQPSGVKAEEVLASLVERGVVRVTKQGRVSYDLEESALNPAPGHDLFRAGIDDDDDGVPF